MCTCLFLGNGKRSLSNAISVDDNDGSAATALMSLRRGSPHAESDLPHSPPVWSRDRSTGTANRVVVLRLNSAPIHGKPPDSGVGQRKTMTSSSSAAAAARTPLGRLLLQKLQQQRDAAIARTAPGSSRSTRRNRKMVLIACLLHAAKYGRLQTGGANAIKIGAAPTVRLHQLQ